MLISLRIIFTIKSQMRSLAVIFTALKGLESIYFFKDGRFLLSRFEIPVTSLYIG
jgi:hypothetical protein